MNGARIRAIGVAVAALGAAGILALTLNPESGDRVEPPIWCLRCTAFGARAATDFVLNVLLYVPLGFGLRLMGTRRRRVLAAVAAVTLAVELLQLRLIPGRTAGISDVFANIAGGGIGVLLVEAGPLLLWPTRVEARRLFGTQSLAWLAITAATAWALRPLVPPPPYRVEWAMNRGAARVTSRPVAAALDGQAVRHGALLPDTTRDLYRRLRDGTVRVEALFASTGPARSEVTLLALRGADRTSILLLEQKGRDLVISARRNARTLRLRNPTITLHDVFPRAATIAASTTAEVETVHVSVIVSPTALEVAATRDGRQTTALLKPHPIMSWALLLKAQRSSGARALLLTAGAIVVVLLPLGYWMQRARQAPLLELLAAGVLVAGFGLIPMIWGFDPAAWPAWALGVGCVATGWLLGRSDLVNRI